MKNEKPIELKPCPFCGETPELQGRQAARCETCGITIHVQRWNCQVGLHRYIRLIEQMREALAWLYQWTKNEIEHFDANTPDDEIIKDVEAALSAAERELK